jgi:hypothetical protein
MEFKCIVKFLAKIVGHSGEYPSRTYRAREVELHPFSDTGTCNTSSRGFSNNKSGGREWEGVINLCEINTTEEGESSVVYNVDTSQVPDHLGQVPTTYPPGFDPKPIGGGGRTNDHMYDRVVEIWHQEGMGWVMSEWGVHDGYCGGDDLLTDTPLSSI